MPTVDLASIVAEEILEQVRTLEGFDKRSAVYVDDINRGPIPGGRTWSFQVARPSVSPGGYSGGAYRQAIMIRMAVFCSSQEDLTRESSSAQQKLGKKAVEVRKLLEGFYGTELNIPLFGMTGPSEARIWQHEDATNGIFWLDWTMRGEKWDTLTLFSAS